MKLSKLKIAAVVTAFGVISVNSAHAVLIDGVEFEAGGQFITTSLWESVLQNPNTDKLTGVGIVNQIDNTSGGGTTWINGQNNTQLTYYFTDYAVSRWADSMGVWRTSASADWVSAFGTANYIDFTGGTINIYADSTITGTVLNPSGAGSTIPVDISKATDGGKLFLSYVGVDTSFNAGLLGVRTGSLLGAVDGGVNNIHMGNSGFGYLNVVGGDAFTHFDTDSYCVGAPGSCVVADARLDTKASTTNSGAWPLSGIASIKTSAIPEPATLGLLGLGLLGMGVSLRKRKAT